ncbi:MAG: hypothetical protein JNK24_05685 [Alphaproteobacteria bacterium]|nr:hypothetical protein [Alphaproteobacteria bacterium]
MSEALLRGAILELKCLRDAMVRRGPFINRTGTATDRLLCRIMVGILNNAIPALEAIQKMSSEQRVQAQALSFVLTLKSKVEHYIDSRCGPLRNSRESEPLKALMANDIERLLSALGNIVYALEKGRAPTASKTPTAAAPASALGEFNILTPLAWLYNLSQLWMSFARAANTPAGNAKTHEPSEAPAATVVPRAKSTRTGAPHLTCIDGDRETRTPQTALPAGVLHLVRP